MLMTTSNSMSVNAAIRESPGRNEPFWIADLEA